MFSCNTFTERDIRFAIKLSYVTDDITNFVISSVVMSAGLLIKRYIFIFDDFTIYGFGSLKVIM